MARSALQTTELAHVSACQALADVVRDLGDWCSGCHANLVFGRGGSKTAMGWGRTVLNIPIKLLPICALQEDVENSRILTVCSDNSN